MSKDIYNLKKPKVVDDKWLIFPNTILNNLNSKDCSDTIEGICYEDKNFNECVDLCSKNDNCYHGYYIDQKGENNNICVPLLTKEFNYNTNPIYSFRSQEIYPELDNMDVSTFIDKTVYKFPPENANIIFYHDHILLSNVNTKEILNNSPISESDDLQITPLFKLSGDLQVQLLLTNENVYEEIYKPILYGDKFYINIPSTNLLLEKEDNEFKWKSRSDKKNDNIFSLHPLTGKKIGDKVLYSDEFILKYNESVLNLDKSVLTLDKNNNIKFKFIPKMKGYYCDKKKCKEIPLENMDINDKGIGNKNGNSVGRNQGCWGMCNYGDYGDNGDKGDNGDNGDKGDKGKGNNKIINILLIIGISIFIGIILYKVIKN